MNKLFELESGTLLNINTDRIKMISKNNDGLNKEYVIIYWDQTKKFITKNDFNKIKEMKGIK